MADKQCTRCKKTKPLEQFESRGKICSMCSRCRATKNAQNTLRDHRLMHLVQEGVRLCTQCKQANKQFKNENSRMCIGCQQYMRARYTKKEKQPFTCPHCQHVFKVSSEDDMPDPDNSD